MHSLYGVRKELSEESAVICHLLFLSSDMETAKKVGSRHGRPVIYQVDCRKMTENGFSFFLSANRVWLTKTVPAEYLSKMGHEL